MMQERMKWFLVAVILAVSFVATGCGSSATVAVKSDTYAMAGAMAVSEPQPVPEFKLCISKVTLVKQEDEDSEDADTEDEVVFRPGLIDASSGESVDWGKIEVPEGFRLNRIKVKVHKDKERCGVDYSVAFNEWSTPEDVEFRFRFDPPAEMNDGDTVVVSLDSVVSALRKAAAAGSLDSGSIKRTIEDVEGTVRHQKADSSE